MTTTEKIAGTYLRLNGFLLLPHFTIFDGQHHGHVDLLGMRAASSEEKINGKILIRDDQFFRHADSLLSKEALVTLFGVVAEVKSNKEPISFRDQQTDYVRRFLGSAPLIRLSFAEDHAGISSRNGGIHIDVRYALEWIFKRIKSMEGMRLTKEGSWTWSEEFLADLLILRKFGLDFELK